MNILFSFTLVILSQAKFNEADWTPRPAGKGEPWESHTDRDWIDKRFREMDTGPFLNCSLEYPYGIQGVRVTRATAIKVGAKGEATMIFDRNLMRWAAGWSDGFLDLSDRRFGLLNVALPNGLLGFSTPIIPGAGTGPTETAVTQPLPRDRAAFNGLFLAGKRVIVATTVNGVPVWESPDYVKIGTFRIFTRNVEVEPGAKAVRLLLGNDPKTIPVKAGQVLNLADRRLRLRADDGITSGIGVVTNGLSEKWDIDSTEGSLYLTVPPRTASARFTIVLVQGNDGDLQSFHAHFEKIVPEPVKDRRGDDRPRWQSMTTLIKRASDDAPLVADSLTVPHDNPHKALMFLTGVDFVPKKDKGFDIAVATGHGDVWLVNGADSPDGKLTWRRFASGMYQPLGIKVFGDAVAVLERGQITLLRDTNGDGEADSYVNFNSDWHVGHGPHSYDTCLQTDPEGNFFFFKTGDTETPTGGCLMRVAADGSKAEIFATGFRHPIGLGISPTGYITGADQEGNWMPATRIDHYVRGGFYGDMRAHHRAAPPKIYDPPICWLPRQVDNSAGGQIWVPKGLWGPLSERCLHLSYGRCSLHLLSKEDIGGTPQGGLIDLKVGFTSGVFTGRFHPGDGHLYLVGLRGWQNAAREDGCLQRVRYTGKPVNVPLEVKIRKDGVVLTFSQPLDKAAAENVANYRLARWNYHWTEDYGSKRYSVKNPKQEGQDDVAVTRAQLLDEKTVMLSIAELEPVMQMQIGYNVRTAAGAPVVGSIYNTINVVPR